jgi:hypothetical protein
MAADDAAAARYPATERLNDSLRRGNVPAMAAALDEGADISGLPQRDVPLISLAVQLRNAEAVRLLLSRGAGVGSSWFAHPPFKFVWPERVSALWPGCIAIAELLLAAGAAAGKPSMNDAIVLYRAAASGCAAGVRQLLAAGARCHTHWDGSELALCALVAAACCRSDASDPVGCLHALLAADEHPADHVSGATRAHLLWRAAQRCPPAHFPGVARLLVQAGADVEGLARETPLVAAARREHVDPLAEPTVPLPAADCVSMLRALLALGAAATPAVWAAGPVAALPRPVRAELVGEAAWARRGRLVALRRQMRQPDEGSRAAANEAADELQGCSAVAGVPAGGTAGHASGMAWTDGPATGGAAFGAGSIP